METKMIKVPFEVEMAKKITKGEIPGKIVTRDGKSVRVVCWDRKGIDLPIVALVDNGDEEDFLSYMINGMWCDEGIDDLDLMLEIPEYLTFKNGDVNKEDIWKAAEMTTEEYAEKFKQIRRKYDKELDQLQEEYALSNNPYKVGDIIEDHMGRIKIKSIEILYESVPSCRYYGPEVRKADNAIKKSGSERYAYQRNVIKKIERV